MKQNYPLPSPYEETYRRYLPALLNNDRQLCRQIFEQWLAIPTDLRFLYDDLVRRSLYEVGDLWEQGKISVATEHIATAISEGLLNLTYPRLFSQPRNGKSAIITCLSNEYHQIGAKMVADFFELHGWRGYFLGANTPLDDLLALIEEKHPDVVALSIAIATNLNCLNTTAREIQSAYPNLPILVGGQAFRLIQPDQVDCQPNQRCLNNLSDLEDWIKKQKINTLTN